MAGSSTDARKTLPEFKAPVIQDNVNGWGPCDMPEQFRDMPYQPFSKGDRLGKVRCLLFSLAKHDFAILEV